ncbi:Fe(3+)-hydroxamate ABC transporter permease FhuB [Roseivivax sp. GX 12232]|uniref:Fe(3+)-hydroxamate ABC transporter permease FhuB n=1 Tax=Roseivivax sp. GX 12232 TaxID=2900547 RepID=UPI001E2FC097|nr:Fe(3+)-hydroxamate ABC transporter permease FhuB [Roseivivax sp. GX 12232]MCE0504023.1 Fe(3+)-hydroxamate ABC transporter permease FhuB [Roseivivax sp. GX 12232]
MIARPARLPLPGLLALTLALVAGHLILRIEIAPARFLALLTGTEAQSFAEIRVTHAVLPRIAMGLAVGAALGLAGSLFQQITGNRLASPLTLGAASGAWLAVVVATLAAPALVAGAREWVSLAGACLAFALVLGIAGLRGLLGLRAVLAGMAVNLLFEALAGALVLLESPYFSHLFVWGAGDLGQSGWQSLTWVLPRLGLAALGALAGLRVLGLLRAGAGGAEARGLSLAPWLGGLALIALFLTAISVAAVGMIGFIGLLAPNLARACGARRPAQEILASALIGAALLTGADLAAVLMSGALPDMVPTGALTALGGAPALVLLLRRRLGAADHAALEMPQGPARLRPVALAALALCAGSALVLALALAQGPGGWQFTWPEPMTLSFRWPRILGAAGAGAAMALSGVILQRVIRNPLASPEVLGMSSGASFALVLTTLLTGVSIHSVGAGVALAGSLGVMVLLLALVRRHGNAPMVVALVGISLGAVLDALVKIALAAGTADSFAILGWLGGSTYRVSPGGALSLAGVSLAGVAAAWAGRRWLTLIAAGDAVAEARGLAIAKARAGCLAGAAALAALVTAVMGPVSFVGLLAPHLATLIGARRAGPQVLAAPVIGAVLMVVSDWMGRVLLYPMQLPAGTIAALLGGGFFLVTLLRLRGGRG